MADTLKRNELTVVIPTLNEARSIEHTLTSILNQAPAVPKIIVVDGGSTDATCRLARKRGARVLHSAPGRGRQLHVGALAATTTGLLFLHGDTRLPPGAIREVTAILSGGGASTSPVGGKFRLSFPHRHPALDLVALLSRLPWAWASYGDSAFFVQRSTYLEIGGFEDLPVFEDLRFFHRLRKAGKVHVMRTQVTTSCRRFCRRGPWRQLAANGRLFLAYLLGASWQSLVGRYQPWSRVESQRGSRSCRTQLR